MKRMRISLPEKFRVKVCLKKYLANKNEEHKKCKKWGQTCNLGIGVRPVVLTLYFGQMARKPRLEIEGGLYHLITRGVDRRDIFHEPEDHRKFLALLAAQKSKLPFYLYAYCLMTYHIHLLIERRTDDVGRTMQRVLTGYSQYYNRKYHKVGHLFQGRYKAILCQSGPYLSELVRGVNRGQSCNLAILEC